MWVQDQLLTSITVSWIVPRIRPSGMITGNPLISEA